MRPSTWVIANPVAGGGRARERIRDLEAAFARWPRPPRLIWSERPGHARDLACLACREGVDTVVAAGGDGTVHEVVNGLLADGPRESSRLAYLPVGTSGDFARALGFTGDLAAWTRDLGGARVRAVDVGRLELAGRPGAEWFVNAVNVGLGARVAERVAGSRVLSRLGPFSYAASTLATLPRHRPSTLTVSVDGVGVWSGDTLNVSICNGPFFGGGMRPARTASLTSGRLHIVIAHAMGRVRAAVQLVRILSARPPDPRRFTLAEGSSAVVEGNGPTVAVEVDGEVPGRLPVRAEIVPGALRVVVPAGPPPPD